MVFKIHLLKKKAKNQAIINTYYRKDSNGNLHSSDDSILISSYNDYQCISTNTEFDEDDMDELADYMSQLGI